MDKLGYLKTVAGTNIPEGKFVLILMALYCKEDGTIRKKDIQHARLASRTHLSKSTIVRHMKALTDGKLITSLERKRIMYWQLPSEAQLMAYTPPK